MNLQGFYTNRGSALAAKIAGGTAALTVTRVDAGSGHTADISSATVLPDTEQTLTVGVAVVEGVTATLPVTLSEAAAEGDYDLTELGVYATDPDEGEVLMQIYQLSAPQEVVAGGEGTLRFYLRQSIGAQGVSVVCSGAGTLTEDDIAPLRERVLATEVPSRSVSVALSDLQDYLDSLPRLLSEHLTINVSGSFTGLVEVKNFYGSGWLTINGGGTAALTGCLYVYFCDVPWIDVRGMSIKASASIENTGVIAERNGCELYLYGCSINGQSTPESYGVNADGAKVLINGTSIRNCEVAVSSRGTAYVAISNVGSEPSYSGNDYGCLVYRGGCITQGTNVPPLLGGSSNIKDGGFIVKGNGTLA